MRTNGAREMVMSSRMYTEDSHLDDCHLGLFVIPYCTDRSLAEGTFVKSANNGASDMLWRLTLRICRSLSLPKSLVFPLVVVRNVAA